ncbi:hypothetical protein PAXRUDRAFT_415667 [Paxillus rubicundulus Ve08.2h10]|uniref:Uncharacterized protein n=1 Tax=Paxillus rubicundulus Ve08.2h10 TaxID=930991 RepID=A0A0D0DXW7_9AGAM|nr:hypothetical protein PAXRUDRAFT_415667 [Paxillus rubicundulus Ve08.2h10]
MLDILATIMPHPRNPSMELKLPWNAVDVVTVAPKKVASQRTPESGVACGRRTKSKYEPPTTKILHTDLRTAHTSSLLPQPATSGAAISHAGSDIWSLLTRLDQLSLSSYFKTG